MGVLRHGLPLSRMDPALGSGGGGWWLAMDGPYLSYRTEEPGYMWRGARMERLVQRSGELAPQADSIPLTFEMISIKMDLQMKFIAQ